MFYNGHGIQEQDSRGRRITDDSFLLAFNAHDDDVDFVLPAEEYSPFWDVAGGHRGPGDTRSRSRPGPRRAAKSMWCCAC